MDCLTVPVPGLQPGQARRMSRKMSPRQNSLPARPSSARGASPTSGTGDEYLNNLAEQILNSFQLFYAFIILIFQFPRNTSVLIPDRNKTLARLTPGLLPPPSKARCQRHLRCFNEFCLKIQLIFILQISISSWTVQLLIELKSISNYKIKSPTLCPFSIFKMNKSIEDHSCLCFFRD